METTCSHFNLLPMFDDDLGICDDCFKVVSCKEAAENQRIDELFRMRLDGIEFGQGG